tara:strand:+ start:777 stop:1640 length:864 start_codon:yes stop_codon:yes gene_type:complete
MNIINNKEKALTNGLYIIATPIGNLDDISIRAIQTLEKVDFIICENPKHSLKLLNNKGIKKKLLSLHDYNEEKIIRKISKLIKNSSIALISDAGSPLISDPGYNLVKFFLDNNAYVTTLPGPSSVIASIQLSGFPINSFAFYGFVPKQKSKINDFINKIDKSEITCVFFISGKNLMKTIEYFSKIMGDREICICKEISKINEQIIKGKIQNILKKHKESKNIIRGEFTVVVSGRTKNKTKKINPKIYKELKKLIKKYNLTEAVKIVHSLTGISKKEIYQTALNIKND